MATRRNNEGEDKDTTPTAADDGAVDAAAHRRRDAEAEAAAESSAAASVRVMGSAATAASYPRVQLAALANPCAHVAPVAVTPLQFAGQTRRPVRFDEGWEYFRRIGSPRHICAPMVSQSELPFRILCRRYNTTLAYTPMFHAEIFGKDASYRADHMQVPAEAQVDRPLVAQFCGNDPQLILKAAKHVEHLVDAVDLNLGCPQGIAKRGHYGSFLLEESQLLHDIVSTLHQHLSVPVTVKIRRLATDEATIALVRMLEEAGAALITIHGRSRLQLKDKVGACDFDLIRLVKQNARVPVLANGGIFTADDVARCLAYTGVDGVMSSEALLCNPTLFAGVERKDSRLVAREYLDIVADLASQGLQTDQASIRAHLFKMLYQHICVARNHDLRDVLAHCDPNSFGEVVDQICARFDHYGDDSAALQAELDTVPLWYHRHQKTAAQLAAAAAKEALRRAEREAAQKEMDEGAEEGFSLFDDFADGECGEQQCDAHANTDAAAAAIKQQA